MSPISLPSILLGILAVGALYALHYLRIQPEQRKVATLLFWKQAIRQQRTRVLFTKRFTHPATFALVALILLALAAVLTADRWGRTSADRRTDVMVIDAGAAMTAPPGEKSSLAAATDLARSDLKQLASTPALIAAGPSPLLLAKSEEPAAVVRDHLASLTTAPPADTTASGSAQALQLARTLQAAAPGDIYWYTTATELPPGLPADVATRVKLRHIDPADAVAITGATFTSPPEDPTHGALTLQVTGKPSASLTATAGTASKPLTFTGNTAEATFPDLAADGSRITVSLTGAAAAPGQTITFTLPRRLPTKVTFTGDIPATLRLALRATGAEEISSSSGGAIAVVENDTPLPAGATAAIRVITAGPALPANETLALTASPLTADLSLEGATAAAGPALAPAGVTLLKAGDAPVATLADIAGVKTLSLSSALLADSADLPKRAAFPVLMGRIAADLAGNSDAQPVVTSLRAIEDPLWQPETPTAINMVHTAPPVAASAAVADTAPVSSAGFLTGLRWVEVLLAAALTLLIVEGLLLASKKIV